jgi:hypothetical protein
MNFPKVGGEGKNFVPKSVPKTLFQILIRDQNNHHIFKILKQLFVGMSTLSRNNNKKTI